MNRRTFVYNAALGTLGTLQAGLAGLPQAPGPDGRNTLQIDVNAPDLPPSPLAMPGLFPGRVIEVFHGGSIVNRRISSAGRADDGGRRDEGAHRRRRPGQRLGAKFVSPTDVVAVKVNPSSAPLTITSIPLLRVVIRALNAAGVPNRNIIVYDRNSNQLEVNGYHALLQAGVRVVGLDQRWTDKGQTRGGYDQSIYCEMDCFGERETRSYLASIVATEADKIINLPVLKEHNASGVTGCLKNLAYGSFNNVAQDARRHQDLHRPGDRGHVQCRRRFARRRC